MATANKKTENVPAKVEDKPNPLAISDNMFAADAGVGMEGASSESFAIPFLSVLQKGSPTVDEALPTYVEGHKAGMFYENVTGRTYDGKAGVVIVPCAYRRVFLRWGPKGVQGSGFKGEILPEDVARLRSEGKIVDLEGKLLFPLPDGSVNEKTCDRVADVRNHYVLLMDKSGETWTNALLSLGSTQIKKSKMLMSALASVKFVGATGAFTPPTFANLVKVTTLGESNDKGSWHGVKFEMAGKVSRVDIYEAAKAFHASVKSGTVEAKYEGADDTEEHGSGDRF